jgi:hypothetical protein
MIELPEKLDFSKADWLLESFRSMRGQDLTMSGQSVKFVGTLCAQIPVSYTHLRAHETG